MYETSISTVIVKEPKDSSFYHGFCDHGLSGAWLTHLKSEAITSVHQLSIFHTDEGMDFFTA